MAKEKKPKRSLRAGGSAPGAPLKFKKKTREEVQAAQTPEQKANREKILTGKRTQKVEAERRKVSIREEAKGAGDAKPEEKATIETPLPVAGRTLEEKKAGPTGLISEKPLTEEEAALREPSITDQPKPVQTLQQTLLGLSVAGVSPKAIKGLGGVLQTPAKLAVSSTGKTALAGLVGLSGITTWLANDNIISGMTIFTRDLREAVTFGQMSV
ncbi:hypothetical protein KAR91_74275, partial [Candidatus Pacearchaeota archaeon]|nr:hypothetical protein [Candidatus Pacearchaeota archaeon]